MPLFELECLKCSTRWESLLKDKDSLADEVCTACGGHEVQMCLSGFGGYKIKGNNSASCRPKNAGSFKAKK